MVAEGECIFKVLLPILFTDFFQWQWPFASVSEDGFNSKP